MIKTSDHSSKGCLITIIIICAIPVVLFIFGVFGCYTEKEDLKKFVKQELVVYEDQLPEYEIEEVQTMTFPDNLFYVTLRFNRPIKNNDIKVLKKKHSLENLGNGKYRSGLLTIDVGSDIGVFENVSFYEESGY